MEHLDERGEEVEVLLLERGEVGADGTESVGAYGRVEAAGDLELDLGHADSLFGKDRMVADTEGLDAQGCQWLALRRQRLVVSGDQEIDHVLGPGLSAFLMDERQLAQMMGVAQRMSAIAFPVRVPAKSGHP